MSARVTSRLRRLARRFCRRSEGSIAPTFALLLIPLVTGVGAAVDYSRANSVKAFLQSTLDVALMAGANDGTSNWMQVALDVFNSNLSSKGIAAQTPSFTTDANSNYLGSAVASVPTSILGVVNIHSVNVNVAAAARMAEADNSCILTLDKGQPKSHESLTLNGAPFINLSGCSIRSNTSMDCNGHDGNSTKSYASGTAVDCAKPKSYVPVVPDIYAQLASNITSVCGNLKGPGLVWPVGSLPPLGLGFKLGAVANQYHVCGDLTVSGQGYLTGTASPPNDMTLVIENGSLIIEENADVKTAKTAIVLTGNNNYATKLEFPQGSGKSASLWLSPPTTVGNPWQAVALYLDPKLTNTSLVDNKWGPGATFNADGLVYLGTSNVVTDGNTASNNSKCSKFVMNSFRTNGSINLDFSQINCAVLGLKQWGGIVVHLIK